MARDSLIANSGKSEQAKGQVLDSFPSGVCHSWGGADHNCLAKQM